MAVFDPSVYVIGTAQMVKIGWASAPIRRLAMFQRGSPVKLRLFFAMVMPSVESARTLEGWAHKMLARERAHGEWFKVAPNEAIETIIWGWEELGRAGRGAYRLAPGAYSEKPRIAVDSRTEMAGDSVTAASDQGRR